MNTRIRNLFLLPVLLTCLGLMQAGPVTAQTFTNLYKFTAFDPGSIVNSDGARPYGGVVLSSNILYGVAASGGSSGAGTVFALNTDGTGFSTLYSFSGGSDGKLPSGGLALSGNTIYGTTLLGGNRFGNVFTINSDGSGFTDLYDFSVPSANSNVNPTNSDGMCPNGGLALSGNTLYGTAFQGGLYANGTVFAVNTDGSGFTTLHHFTANTGYWDNPPSRNTDGAIPYTGLIISGSTLYGTTSLGGLPGYGTVFKVNTDGTGFAVLHSFTATKGSAYPIGTNSDGAVPISLILSGNTLYGTTKYGGSEGSGTVFKVNTNGTGFTTVYTGNALYETTCLVLSGKTLHWRLGDVFAVNTDGTGFMTYYTGDAGWATGLILSGNTLYGEDGGGGNAGNGMIFSFFIPPQLKLTPSGPNIVLTWPTNATGFTLQSTTNLGASALWTTNLPSPVVVNDQNVVTNPITGIQQFFRLSQ